MSHCNIHAYLKTKVKPKTTGGGPKVSRQPYTYRRNMNLQTTTHNNTQRKLLHTTTASAPHGAILCFIISDFFRMLFPGDVRASRSPSLSGRDWASGQLHRPITL